MCIWRNGFEVSRSDSEIGGDGCLAHNSQTNNICTPPVMYYINDQDLLIAFVLFLILQYLFDVHAVISRATGVCVISPSPDVISVHIFILILKKNTRDIGATCFSL